MNDTATEVQTSVNPSLKESELRYRRLFEAAQDGILILDAATGAINDVNPFLIEMLGYSREEFMERKLWEVGAFQDVEASREAFQSLQKNKYIRYKDLPLRAKDGKLIPVEFVSNVYLAGEQKVIQCNIRDITERKQVEDVLLGRQALYREQSIRDYLTGLFNRRYLQETLDREILRAARKQLPLGIIMLDVDDFKRINDSHGHAAGDSILQELGKLLIGYVRGEDIVCRYGGDEFTIVLPEASLEVTRQRAELLCEYAKHFQLQWAGSRRETVTLSLGVAIYPQHGANSADVLSTADQALYRAKLQGRGRVAVAG